MEQKKKNRIKWFRRTCIFLWFVFSCNLFLTYIPTEDLPLEQVTVNDANRKRVKAAGTNIGIYLKNAGVLVVACASFTDQNGALISPAAYRMRSGDIIQSVDGRTIASKEELIQQVEESRGRKLVLEVQRGAEQISVAVTPEIASDGSAKLGLWVRDDIAGIGTLTFVTEDHAYGALGHGVNDIDTGELIKIEDGGIYETKITGISKGMRGTPGEVTGLIRFYDASYLGTIRVNGTNGIYGELAHMPKELENEAWIPVGYKQEIKKGRAQIICSVAGQRKAYDIEIEAVDHHPKEENKAIRYRVVDEELLEDTGGIIQGMSGSPIIQNGCLIGAVTHVFVDDPTRGYGIFSESMLQEATQK